MRYVRIISIRLPRRTSSNFSPARRGEYSTATATTANYIMMSIKEQANLILRSSKSKNEKVLALCDLVREIPYQRTNNLDPQEMLRKGTGSCTPKHIFLATYLEKIGIQVKFVVMSFYYWRMPLRYPQSKMELVNEMPISYHVALKAKVENKWVLIDVTWDSKLKGFPNSAGWKGEGDMKLAVIPEKIIEVRAEPNRFDKSEFVPYSKSDFASKEPFHRFFDKFLTDSRK